MKRFSALLGLVLFTGCIPLAMLRSPEPTKGTAVTAGGSLLFATGGSGQFAVLPYLALARGDGESEFNFSVQFGVRAGLKQRIGDGLSFDAGLTVPPFFLISNFTGLPLGIDAGIIWGLENFYVSPRLEWLGFNIGSQTFSGLLYQLSLGYAQPEWITEFSSLFNSGGAIFSVSAALRF